MRDDVRALRVILPPEATQRWEGTHRDRTFCAEIKDDLKLYIHT